MSKENGICKEEVCYCIKDAIICEDTSCLFIPDDMESHMAYLDQWNDIDEEMDEAIVIVNPIEEFVFDEEKYFRVIKTIAWDISDFRLIEEKFGICVYLRKVDYDDIGKYVFYYKGKPVHIVSCPPTYMDVRYILRMFPEFQRQLDEMEAINIFLGCFQRLTYLIHHKL